MTRYEVTLRLEPPSGRLLAAYRHLGLEPPSLTSQHAQAAVWPYRPRFVHRLFARMHGYFWLPCVLCTEPFGGHELTDSIPDPTREPVNGTAFMMICPACTAERNGGHVLWEGPDE